MIAVSTTILIFFALTIGVIIGILIGAVLTVIGMQKEKTAFHKGMWQMQLLGTDKTIQEFYNCPTIGLKFKDLDKDIPRAYEIKVSRIYEDKSGLARYMSGKSTKTDVVMRYYE